MPKDFVLIIEDEKDWQNRIKITLEERGSFSLDSASDFVTAIKKIETIDPLALVLDLKLGDGEYNENDWEGWELARQAREKGIATVILTGLAAPRISSRAFREFNVVDLIDKGYFLEHKPLFFQRVVEAMEITRRRRIELQQDIELNNFSEATEDSKPHDDSLCEAIKIQFDLFKLDGIGKKFYFRIENSKQGEPQSEFNQPFSTKTLETLLHIIQEERADFSKLYSDEKRLLKKCGINPQKRTEKSFLEQLGIKIYDALTVDRAGVAITNVVQNASTSETWATVQFRYDDGNPELAKYPWELIHDGYSFLARDQISLVRYVSCPLPSPRLQLAFPLKVLFVVPRPQDTPNLDDEEKEAIANTVKEVGQDEKFDFFRLENPISYKRMLELLNDAKRNGEPFDAIYFDGHGKFGWRCPQCREVNEPEYKICKNSNHPNCIGTRGKLETFLFFEDRVKQKDAVNASTIETALIQTGVQMVLLSACSTGKIGRSTVFNSLGPKLIGRLVPVVVAMQFPIRTSDTLSFFKTYFRKLSERDRITVRSIENAVRFGRRSVLSDRWFYPVLYMRAR
jgi:CheY-like chemotaxis protein